MGNEQDKTGQQRGQMSGGKPDEHQKGGQGAWQDKQGQDPGRASGANQQGAKGGHSPDKKSDNARHSNMDDDSQADKDQGSGMTDKNR
ncbi:stress-induced protein [Pseudomonas sp. NPDC089547]|uniref:stress-induced protein n=1 Tax=Pseudomonas sp. NPDC089547 TaxID=3390652 RepID=UPI003CFD562B